MFETSQFRKRSARNGLVNQDNQTSQLTFEKLEDRLLLSAMPLTLDITHLTCDTDPDSPADFGDYNCFIEFQQDGKVIAGFLTPITTADAAGDGIDVNWSLSANVDTTKGQVSIAIRVRDHDGGTDDFIDVSPISGARDFFRLKFDPLTGQLTNEDGTSLIGHDRQGITTTPDNPKFFSSSGDDGGNSLDYGEIRFSFKYGLANGDSDGDGLLDTWETWGIDASNPFGPADLTQQPDYVLRLQGANPDHKDLFVEVDAMQGPGAPAAVATEAQAVANVVSAFAAAPNSLVRKS